MSGSSGHNAGMSDPLDNVIWSALTTCQAAVAAGAEKARRYDPAFARFAALSEVSPASLADLARLSRPGEELVLFEHADIDPGPAFDVVGRKGILQMILPTPAFDRLAVADTDRFVALGPDDEPQMQALVALTEPGPFAPRTPELGRYLGFKVDGRLVAMAGERMHLTQHTEISAVCTHPDWRGKGLAADLMRLCAKRIVERGEWPFLHALTDNAGAIALYERLGFARRLVKRIALLRRNELPPG
jgi:ribosomal protein S18 acetylase RimI-like enzyme